LTLIYSSKKMRNPGLITNDRNNITSQNKYNYLIYRVKVYLKYFMSLSFIGG